MPNIAAGASATFTPGVGQYISIQAGGGAVAAVSVGGVARDRVSAPRVIGPYAGSSVTIDALGGPVFYELQTRGSVVAASRALTADDNGQIVECSATATLTVPAGLPAGFSCAVIPSGTTTVASSGGVLLNGATSTLTRTASSNPMFAIVGRATADSYVITGA